jgi:aminopeptidase N
LSKRDEEHIAILPVELEHLRLELALDFDARSITGRCLLDVRGRIDATDRLELDASELDLREVRGNGDRLRFRCVDDKLVVELCAPLRHGESLRLEISYTARPRRGLYFIPAEGDTGRPAEQVWTHGQPGDARAWFPCFDHPAVKASTEVIASGPAQLQILSNGVLVSTTVHDGRRTSHWRLDAPHASYLVALVVAELAEHRLAAGPVEIVSYAAPGREDALRRTVRRTPEMMALFERLFGPYPYARYAQVFVSDFAFGGMENTTLTIFTETNLLDERASADFDVEIYLAHEMLHHWFGNLVTPGDWADCWLSEGFGVYAQYLWREHAYGEDAAALELDEWSERYFAEDHTRYRRILVDREHGHPGELFDRHSYEKGGFVLHMLRRLLGDGVFFAAARTYLEAHRGGAVSTRDLRRAFESVSGRELGWFFDQWVWVGAGYPELRISYRWDRDQRRAVLRIVQQQQDEHTPVFRIITAVRFVVGDREIDLTIELREACHELEVPLEDAPSQVIFDPGKHLLAAVQFAKPAELWRAELRGARHAADRIAAARASSGPAPETTDALLAALASDPCGGVRVVAATALGRIGGSRARDGLVEALRALHPSRVRTAIIVALGGFARDALAAAAIRRVIDGPEASCFVEAAAYEALGRTRVPDAAQVLREGLARTSFRDVIVAAIYTGLAEHGGQAEVGSLIDVASQRDTPRHGRLAALAALVRLAGRANAISERVIDVAASLLSDGDPWVRESAIDALETIADDRAIAALRGKAAACASERIGLHCELALRRLARRWSARCSPSVRHDRSGIMVTEDAELQRLIEHIKQEASLERLAPDDELLDSGLLSSIEMVSIIVFVSDLFGVEFDTTEIVPENLRSPRRIVEFARERRASLAQRAG